MRIFRVGKTNVFKGEITEKQFRSLQKKWGASRVTYLYPVENTYRDLGKGFWFSIPESKLSEFLRETK